MLRQISAHSVEPMVARRSRSLLSQQYSGSEASLSRSTDESIHVWPQMPWIIDTEPFAGRRERLTGAGSGPDGPVVRPSSQSSCNGPEPGSGEEMDLRVACEVIGLDILDAAVIDVARRDQPIGDQAAQDMRGVLVELVVVGARHPAHDPRAPKCGKSGGISFCW